MSTPSIYAQSLAGGRNFRLLCILPAFKQDQPLECYCLPFAIDDAPRYEALSYVWGSPEPTAELSCNGQTVAIQLELANALRRLRLRETTRMVWADAICINQKDIAERNYQVLLMGSIYSLASRAVVWLGIGDKEQIQEAWDCIQYITKACRQYDQDRNWKTDSDTRHDTLSLSKDVFNISVCRSLQELFNRPWFSRIWCVQEIRLAQEALILWGEQEISWADLGLAASWIFDKITSVDKSDPVIGLLNDVAVAHADIMRYKKMDSLLDTLQNYREFEASDLKDKVYGLLSLVSSRSEVEALGVDYNKSVAEVYSDTVLAVIKLYSRLTSLAYITHPVEYDGNEEYSSWTPRWDDLAVARILAVPEDDCPWSASGRTMVTLAEASPLRSRQLCLKGIIYEKVQELEEVMDDNLADPEHSKEHSQKIEDNPSDLDDIETSIELHPFLNVSMKLFYQPALDPLDEKTHQRFCFLARTLTAGTWDITDIYVQLLDADTQGTYYGAFFRFMTRLAQLQQHGDEGEHTHDTNSKQFEADAYHTCLQRRMFWTENGFLGLGPQCMQVGDIVVVLFGGNTPYVLRPKGNGYLFMGQAYVDNIMNGELMDRFRAGDIHEQTFCLL